MEIQNRLYLRIYIPEGKHAARKSLKPLDLIPERLGHFVFEENRNRCLQGCEIIYKDPAMLSENLPVTGPEEIVVQFGRKKEEHQKLNFKLLTYKSMALSPYTGDLNVSRWVFIDEHHKGFLQDFKSRAFTKKKVSDVVRTIVKEIGISAKNIDIEETKGEFTFFQTPNQNNLKFIRSIAPFAVSGKTGVGGYSPYISRGKFSFISRESEVAAKPKKLYMAGQFESLSYPLDELNHIPIMGFNFSINSVIPKGKKKVYKGYSWDRKEVVEKEDTLNDMSDRVTSLGSKLPTTGESSHTELVLSGEEDPTKSEAQAQNELYDGYTRFITGEIVAQGDPKLEPGHLILIVLPSNDKEEQFNAVYSGVWLVEKVVHYIKGLSYFNRVVISRSGFLSNRFPGLITASKFNKEAMDDIMGEFKKPKGHAFPGK